MLIICFKVLGFRIIVYGLGLIYLVNITRYAAFVILQSVISDVINSELSTLPVGVIDCMEAGIVSMKIDESRKSGKIIDLTSTWKNIDSILS